MAGKTETTKGPEAAAQAAWEMAAKTLEATAAAHRAAVATLGQADSSLGRARADFEADGGKGAGGKRLAEARQRASVARDNVAELVAAVAECRDRVAAALEDWIAAAIEARQSAARAAIDRRHARIVKVFRLIEQIRGEIDAIEADGNEVNRLCGPNEAAFNDPSGKRLINDIWRHCTGATRQQMTDYMGEMLRSLEATRDAPGNLAGAAVLAAEELRAAHGHGAKAPAPAVPPPEPEVDPNPEMDEAA